jgi:hypothetical protein
LPCHATDSASGASSLIAAEVATGFQTRPFYGGNPWFLAPAVTYYRWRDKVGA